MSGSHSGTQGHAGTGQDASSDPSMEDILASIRRILSEEDAPAAEPAPHAAAPSVPPEPGGPDVLLLDETMLVPEARAPIAAAQPPAETPLDDDTTVALPLPPAPPMALVPPVAIRAAPVLLPVPHPERPDPVPAASPIAPTAPLEPAETGPASPHQTTETTSMSGSTPASLGQGFNPSASIGLASAETTAAAAGAVSNLVRALTSDRNAQVHSGGPTIADLVREEMRPMVKAWLDSNLPPLVERLVRAEIERVISRASI